MTRYKWTTRDGRKLFVDEMGDRHLLNSRSYVASRESQWSEALSAGYGVMSLLEGDQALLDMERQVADVEKRLCELQYVKSVLDAEIKKRGLEVTA